jgi:hypothetical protein
VGLKDNDAHGEAVTFTPAEEAFGRYAMMSVPNFVAIGAPLLRVVTNGGYQKAFLTCQLRGAASSFQTACDSW